MRTRRNWSDIRVERENFVEDRVEGLNAARLRMDLAQLVYDLRDEAGITQKELAERMGTTQSVIALLEGGGTNPSAEFLQRLGQALNVGLVLTVEGRGESAQSVVINSRF